MGVLFNREGSGIVMDNRPGLNRTGYGHDSFGLVQNRRGGGATINFSRTAG